MRIPFNQFKSKSTFCGDNGGIKIGEREINRLQKQKKKTHKGKEKAHKGKKETSSIIIVWHRLIIIDLFIRNFKAIVNRLPIGSWYIFRLWHLSRIFPPPPPPIPRWKIGGFLSFRRKSNASTPPPPASRFPQHYIGNSKRNEPMINNTLFKYWSQPFTLSFSFILQKKSV